MKVAIIGTVGVPANYGGFETLAENLIKYNDAAALPNQITVYCSTKNYSTNIPSYLSAKLKYVPLNANGAQSILYDIWSIFSSIYNHHDVILLLGVSGAIVLPIIRFLSNIRVIVNIDGVEWRRPKWNRLARLFLRLSEKIAVRFSDEVIADNRIMAEYIKKAYDIDCSIISYGGDHAVKINSTNLDNLILPSKYALSICRIEPENNVPIILEAFSQQSEISLLVVGNWDNSEYGNKLRMKYSDYRNILMLDPIYDLGKLNSLRSNAFIYVHGHSAGGTNPSLVEAMHFGIPILTYDCNFNRATTEEKALFFTNSDELLSLINSFDLFLAKNIGSNLLEVAQKKYTWDIIGEKYFALLMKA